MSGIVGSTVASASWSNGETFYGDDDSFLKGFNVELSWDYPDDFSLKDVQDTAFYVYDEERDSQRSESQFLCDSVRSAGAGILLLKPPHETGDRVPCELHIVPSSQQQSTTLSSRAVGEFCVLKLTIVSESKHLELYIDDMYEETSKGCMMTVKKGKKPALYECEFDLAHHAASSPKISIKFLSLGQSVTMRLQAVVVKVMRYPTQPTSTNPSPTPTMPAMNLGSVDMNGVRDMLDSMGLQIPSGANKIMSNIEHQQKQIQLTQLQGMANAGLMVQLHNLTQQQQTLQQQTQAMQLLQMMAQGAATATTTTSTPLLGNNVQPFNGVGGVGNPLQQLLLGQQLSQSSPNTMSTGSSSTSHTGSRTGSPRENGSNGKYPISRETVPPTQKSFRGHSLDRYDGFGAPNPPNESVLENAIKNEDTSRELARSRASLIEERNIEKAEEQYEKTQLELVKNFLRSQNCAQITITKRSRSIKQQQQQQQDRHSISSPVRRPQREGWSSRPRPHSMAGIPTASEADFTKLLTGLMDQETTNDTEPNNDEESVASTHNARWETYLRSRIRASHRLSSASNSRPNSAEYFSEPVAPEQQDPFSPMKRSSSSSFQQSTQSIQQHESNRCPACGCPGCGVSSEALAKQLERMEERITERLELKIQSVQENMDRRVNQLFQLLSSQQHEVLAQYDYMNVNSSAV